MCYSVLFSITTYQNQWKTTFIELDERAVPANQVESHCRHVYRDQRTLLRICNLVGHSRELVECWSTDQNTRRSRTSVSPPMKSKDRTLFLDFQNVPGELREMATRFQAVLDRKREFGGGGQNRYGNRNNDGGGRFFGLGSINPRGGGQHGRDREKPQVMNSGTHRRCSLYACLFSFCLCLSRMVILGLIKVFSLLRKDNYSVVSSQIE